MTGVLHPIGPEPERTYWIRRAVFLAVLIVLVGGLVAVATTIGRGSPPVAATAPGETPDSTPTPTAQLTPTPTAASTPTPTASPTASPTATPTKQPGGSSSKPSSEKPSSPTATSSPAVTSTAPAAALCTPSQLSSKLSGDRTLTVDQNTTFTVSLTNAGATPCTLAVAPSTFELKIYSGTDRIWSTKDCTSEIDPTTAVVKAGQAMTWKQDWNGRRSAAKCRTDTNLPQPGVYWATAQYTGAEPTQLRMIIS